MQLPLRVRRRPALVAIIIMLFARMLLGGAGVAAHDVPRESVMNAFFKVEGERAHLVIRVPLILLGTMGFPASAQRELDLTQAGPATEASLAAIGEEIVIREHGERLVPIDASGRLSLPSDRSLGSYEVAVAHVARTNPPGTVIYADQGFLDAHFTYTIADPASDFSIQTTMIPTLGDHLTLLVRYLPLDGASRAFELTTNTGEVALDPHWYQAARVFLWQGFLHILSGIDHLLFLLCLVIPFRTLRGLWPVVTSFTIAHSITLIAAAYGIVPSGTWFSPLVETLIAASIFYMAIENIVAADLGRRWAITGAFGLVHGFGFSSGLVQDFQFAGSHLLLSLVSFNIGIEIGQVLVLLLVLPALRILFGRVMPQRLGVIILSALLAHTSWHWMTERADGLRQVGWSFDEVMAAMQPAWWAALLLAIGGALWLAAIRLDHRARPRVAGAPAALHLGHLWPRLVLPWLRRLSSSAPATQSPKR